MPRWQSSWLRCRIAETAFRGWGGGRVAEGCILKTFLHISDIHIGDRLGGSQAGPYDAQVEKYISIHNIMHGLLGHHHLALEQIEDFFHEDLGTESPQLIVSGDLTRNGAKQQLARAATFLGKRLQPPYGLAGLEQLNWRDLAISGNHDQWPGRNRPLGRPKIDINKEFSTPEIRHLPLPGDRAVEFLRIDTDADVHPISVDRFYARGLFKSQLDSLRQQLSTTPGDKIFRVLLLHHSLGYRCPKDRGILEIDYYCRKELKRFIRDFEVKVLLSGHAHTASIERAWIDLDDTKWRYLEARCGTSSVVDEFPPAWLPSVRRRTPFERNTLLVHRIVERSDGVYWAARAFRRSPLAQQRFTDAALPPIGGQKPVAPDEIKVL
jgi:hypothetical protein